MVIGNYFDWTDGNLTPGDVYLDGISQRDVLRAITGHNGEVHIRDASDNTQLRPGMWERYSVVRGHVIVVFGDDNRQMFHCEPKP